MIAFGPVKFEMPNPKPIALHFAVRRVYGPQRYEIPMTGWVHIDDANPPLLPEFKNTIDEYKMLMAYALTTSNFCRLRPSIIELPQELPVRAYFNFMEQLGKNFAYVSHLCKESQENS